MNAPGSHHDWTDANQRLLVAEFARIKARLAGENSTVATEHVIEMRAAMPASSAIDRVADCFGLSTFECDVLLLCAGVEMDSNLAGLCAANSNTQRSQATFGLALAALAEPHWSALSPVRPLRRWRLVEVTDESSLTNARLRIDERVIVIVTLK